MVEGARKKNEEWQAEKGDTILLDAEDLKEKRLTNAMFKLEHVQADKEIIRQAAPLISQLEKRSYLLWNDNFSQSSQVRKLFREKKSILERQKDDREKFREKFQLDPSVPVLDEIPEDLNKAQLLLSTSSISKGTSPTLARITKALKKRRKLGKSVV